MKIRTQVKAGALVDNHNETLRVMPANDSGCTIGRR